jgi:hypothetical protein
MEYPRVTLHELQTVYSLEDLYDLLEVGTFRALNERLAYERAERERERGG